MRDNGEVKRKLLNLARLLLEEEARAIAALHFYPELPFGEPACHMLMRYELSAYPREDDYINRFVPRFVDRLRKQMSRGQIIVRHRKRGRRKMSSIYIHYDMNDDARVSAQSMDPFGRKFRRDDDWILITQISHLPESKRARFIVEPRMLTSDWYDRECAKEIMHSILRIDLRRRKRACRIAQWVIPKQSSDATFLTW